MPAGTATPAGPRAPHPLARHSLYVFRPKPPNALPDLGDISIPQMLICTVWPRAGALSGEIHGRGCRPRATEIATGPRRAHSRTRPARPTRDRAPGIPPATAPRASHRDRATAHLH
jgi:hypothetical protein